MTGHLLATELSPEEYLRRIRTSAVYNVAKVTPLDAAPRLSQRLRQNVWFKREDLQPIHSFKIRGAYQRMTGLDSQALALGVVAASAGNHAQGVAWAARELGTAATIVVPETTPEIKQSAIRSMGATLEVFGDTYDDAYHHASEIATRTGREFIHPYDHPATIIGQGTIGLEIFNQIQNADIVFVPVGGGGLIAGVAAVIKQLSPGTKVIGVEADDADAMTQSMRAGERVALSYVGSFADGCAVKKVGEETFRLCQMFVDEMMIVSSDEICAAIKDVFEEHRALPEPAGALAVAGLTKWARTASPGQNAVAIISGANLNFDRLHFIAERTATGSGREMVLSIQIPEQAGSFVRLCHAIGKRNLTEFNYRFGDANQATVFAGISVSGPADADALKHGLSKAKFHYSDLTHDETAKLHIRHLVGGRNPDPTPERIFRVDFPERAGALAVFLDQLGSRWNISLFHYRNHGADRGRALVGFQVPPETSGDFDQFTVAQPFPMREVTESPAIQEFLTHKNQYAI